MKTLKIIFFLMILPAVLHAEELQIDAGQDQSVEWPNELLLDAKIKEGRPTQVSWKKISGPGNVLFSKPHGLKTFAYPEQPGKYAFQIKAVSGSQEISDILEIEVVKREPKKTEPLETPKPETTALKINVSADNLKTTEQLTPKITVTNGGTFNATPVLPQVQLASYFGYFGKDRVEDIVTDHQGNIYIAGGVYDDRAAAPSQQAFVTKLDSSGAVVWSLLVGGTNYDEAHAIDLDAGGNIWIAGQAGEGFPVTPGAWQTIFGGDDLPDPAFGKQDGFIAKISADGTQVLYATYFGGAGKDYVQDLLASPNGIFVAAGNVQVAHPAVGPDALQPTLRGPSDALIAKFSLEGNLEAASYLGGDGREDGKPSLALTPSRQIIMLLSTDSASLAVSSGAYQSQLKGTAADLFLVEISSNLDALLHRTYLGGSGVESLSRHNLTVDKNGVIYVAAITSSLDFPSGTSSAVAATNDGFVAVLPPDMKKLSVAFAVGGSGTDEIAGVALNSTGELIVSGTTRSSNFSILFNRNGSVIENSPTHAFVAGFAPGFNGFRFVVPIDGEEEDSAFALAVDSSDRYWVGGKTASPDFPVKNAFQTESGGNEDAWLAELAFNS